MSGKLFQIRSTLLYGVALIVSLTFVLSTFLNTASAQNAGISVSPPMAEYSVSPGESVSGTVMVSNKDSVSASYEVTLNNFSASNSEDGGAAYLPSALGGLASWTSVNPTSFSLQGRAATEISYTINVPSNAAAGGHYATLFVRKKADSSVAASGSTIETLVGSHILVNVSGNVIERASITEFSTPRSRVNAGEKMEFNLRLANSGNTHLRPSGVVELYRKGLKVGEAPVNSEGANVLPNSTRKFTAFSESAILPGAYTAKLVLTYGSSSQVLVSPDIQFAVIGDSSMLGYIVAVMGVVVVLLCLVLLSGRKKQVIK